MTGSCSQLCRPAVERREGGVGSTREEKASAVQLGLLPQLLGYHTVLLMPWMWGRRPGLHKDHVIPLRYLTGSLSSHFIF